MKKIILSLAVIVSCSVSFALLGCQNDEAEMGSNEKVDLLMAKSEEFAKKYDVDVSLNRDYVEAHADEMTVEGMEADYRGFAELKAKSQKRDLNAQGAVSVKKMARKSFIRRRKVETEIITPDMSDKEGEMEDFNTLNELCCGGYYLHYSAKATWKSENGTISFVLTEVKLECTSPMCIATTTDRKHCGTCEAVFESSQKVNAQGMIIDGKTNFSGSCEVGSMSVCAYTFNHVVASLSYTEGSRGGSINLSIM